MKQIYFLSLLLLSLLISGCGSQNFVMQPAQMANVDTMYYEGDQILLSQAENSLVAMMNRASNGVLRATLFFVSGHDQSVEIQPESIRAYAVELERVDTLDVRSPSEVLEEKRDELQNQQLAMVFAEAMAGATRPTDPVAAELDESQQKERIDQFSENQATAYSSVENTLLRRHTLAPHEEYVGDVYIEGNYISASTTTTIEIEVPFGPETHVFHLIGPEI